MVKNILINLCLINQKHFISKLYPSKKFHQSIFFFFLNGNLSDYWQIPPFLLSSLPHLSSLGASGPGSQSSPMERYEEQCFWGTNSGGYCGTKKEVLGSLLVPRELRGRQYGASGSSSVKPWWPYKRLSHMYSTSFRYDKFVDKLKMDLPGQNLESSSMDPKLLESDS